MLSTVSWLSGIALAGIALLSPSVAPLQINAILDDCTCKMSVVTLTDDVPSAEPGVFVANCGQCLGVFTEMVEVKPGVCTGQACVTTGECKGQLRVQLTSVSSACCASIAGGYQPSWGSGWLAPGSTTTKVFDPVAAKCGGDPATEKWSLKYRNAQGAETTQEITSTISCSRCIPRQ